MPIAVLGWGSLIWCPGALRIKSRWYRDGPELPIEFARISSDERLTLVLHDGAPPQKTYWAISEFEDLGEARENLKTREGTSRKNIHWLKADSQDESDLKGNVPENIATIVRTWMKSKVGKVDAAIWTGLTGWGNEFTVDTAVDYLSKLEARAKEAKNVFERAREYMTNTPSQIQTEVRKRMREKGWEDNQLSKSLFEE